MYDIYIIYIYIPIVTGLDVQVAQILVNFNMIFQIKNRPIFAHTQISYQVV